MFVKTMGRGDVAPITTHLSYIIENELSKNPLSMDALAGLIELLCEKKVITLEEVKDLFGGDLRDIISEDTDYEEGHN